MRDRLIELLNEAHKKFIKSDSVYEFDFLADYLLENGVIVPPCKVGDMVYVTFSIFYAEYKISQFIYDGIFIWARLVNEEYAPQDREILRCIDFDINKTIFLTEDEAKAKIALMRGWGKKNNG